jgi:hypothetical protein
LAMCKKIANERYGRLIWVDVFGTGGQLGEEQPAGQMAPARARVPRLSAITALDDFPAASWASASPIHAALP